jgi:predicted MFS family arabinose efflux permease
MDRVSSPPVTAAANAPPLWKNRDYMLLWSGQVVSTLGSSAAAIIYPLLILAISGSPGAAGAAAALRALPYLLFSLPVGALIDRWNRKHVMIACDVLRAAAVLTIPLALWCDALTLWHVYAVAFTEGSLFVFFNIAEVAALSRVVPTSDLPRAAAQNEAAFGAAHIAGPSLGTMLFQTMGRAAPFVADAITYLVSAASLWKIKTDFRPAATRGPHRLRAEIAEGLRWLWHQPLIRYMALLTGGINFVYAATPLMLIVLAKQMGASDLDIGLVFSIGGISGIAGSLIGGRIQRRFSFGQVITTVIWAQALLFPLYLVVPKFYLLGAVYALIYTLAPVYNVVQFSHRLALIPDALQGRVNSSFRLLAFGFNPLGAALCGLLLEAFGSTPTVLFFAAWYGVMAVATQLNPHVRNAPRPATAPRT